MRVLLTGGTGFIGGALARALGKAGHDVTIVSRQPGHVPAKAIPWDGVAAAMSETDAVVNLAAQAGVTAIIQPGGSARDEMAIEVADRHHMAMVFTGKRHFRH